MGQRYLKYSYKIRFSKLPPQNIFNNISVQRNPKNNLHIQNFLKILEKSIIKEGFRNPILISALKLNSIDSHYHTYSTGLRKQKFLNKLIPDEFKSKETILVCYKQGGSRLEIAQKYNLEVPCLISDFCNYFPDFDPLGENTIRELFKDSVSINYKHDGIVIKY